MAQAAACAGRTAQQAGQSNGDCTNVMQMPAIVDGHNALTNLSVNTNQSLSAVFSVTRVRNNQAVA